MMIMGATVELMTICLALPSISSDMLLPELANYHFDSEHGIITNVHTSIY